eukprot:TRINITY_DN6650_c0_g3_i3.p1 TRINITY_DN6650_c0_g3~~TRINITY_DN6650_c0_g3_i3.p1  ORF type:complete len:295 (-),score=68.40 TRINITY_DN6650_c0_g3_i3:77-865(-)
MCIRDRFWNCALFMAISQFIIASCAAMWYFSNGGGQQYHNPLTRSVWRVFRYHLGSLAFGSLILAIVQTIRVVISYYQAQLKKGADNYRLLQYLLTCSQCLFDCLERFIKFLNKNAYIQIAIKGSNFCQAAKDAFALIWQNPIRFSVLAGIGSIFLFIGKIFIAFATTVCGYLIITRAERYKNAISSPILPSILFFIIGYFIGVGFMSVYGMAADAILQCFCLDEELCKKNNRASYAPKVLQDFITDVERTGPGSPTTGSRV